MSSSILLSENFRPKIQRQQLPSLIEFKRTALLRSWLPRLLPLSRRELIRALETWIKVSRVTDQDPHLLWVGRLWKCTILLTTLCRRRSSATSWAGRSPFPSSMRRTRELTTSQTTSSKWRDTPTSLPTRRQNSPSFRMPYLLQSSYSGQVHSGEAHKAGFENLDPLKTLKFSFGMKLKLNL